MINRRRRYGDWEGDTIVGKGRRSALVTLVERKSGYARIGRIDSMKSDMTVKLATRRMKDLPPSLRQSVTFDNGKEFAEHQKLTRGLGLEVYFTDAYARTRTRMDYCGSIFPKAPISRRSVTARWPAWNN